MAIFQTVVDVVQSLLDIWCETNEGVCDSFRHMAITVKCARWITAMHQLFLHRPDDLACKRPNRGHVLVDLTAILPVSNQNNGCAKKTGIANEAARITHRTRCAR